MSEPIDLLFGALADPTRRLLVERLGEFEATATQLASTLPISRQAVAKHLAALDAAGVVRAERTGRETRYTLVPDALEPASAWVRQVGSACDRRLDRLRGLAAEDRV